MIEDRQERISRLFDRYDSTNGRGQWSGTQTLPSPPLSDASVLELLRNAKNKDKFERLYDHGDLAYYGGDESAADQALVNLIYFYTQDKDQIDRIFRGSALCRPKWLNRLDYRERTINTAGQSITELYQPDDGARLIVGGGGSNGNRHRGVSLSPSPNTRDTGDTFEIIQLCDEEEPQGERPFLIEGVMPERFPTALYGDGGTAKTMLANHLAQSVARGEPDWLGHRITKRTNVLIIDFELDREEQIRRAYELARGMGRSGPAGGVYYFCAAGQSSRSVLTHALGVCEENGVGLVIIDSLGVAMEGDAEASRDVLRFVKDTIDPFRAAGITSCIIDHQSKLQAGERYQNKTMFGSVYKRNMVRSVFQVEVNERLEDGLRLILRHNKTNFGRQLDPFGARITWEHKTTTIEPDELTQSELAAEGTMNVKNRILLALEDGPMFPDELLEIVDAKPKTIKNKLSDLRKAGKVEDTGEVRDQSHQVRLTRPPSLRVPSVPNPIGDRDGDTSVESKSGSSRKWAESKKEILSARKVGGHETFGLQPTPSHEVDAACAAENPELWELLNSLSDDYLLPFEEHVREFKERYGPSYSVHTPQQLVFNYVTSGYAKPKFRIRDGRRVFTGLVAA